RWLKKIIADPQAAGERSFTALPPARQALVLDAASDYFLYKLAGESGDAAAYRERNRAVLLARSKLRVPFAPLAIEPFAGPPEQGHPIMRAGFGAGWREGEFFNELNFRLAYHDLLDPENGYTPDAQIEALGIALRHYYRSDRTRLDRFTLVDILSLSPMNDLFQSPSWKVNIGFQTIRHNGCRFCGLGFLNPGIGAAVETALLKREVYFGFAELAAEYGPVLKSDYRIGGGATVGTLIDFTERWKIGAWLLICNFRPAKNPASGASPRSNATRCGKIWRCGSTSTGAPARRSIFSICSFIFSRRRHSKSSSNRRRRRA